MNPKPPVVIVRGLTGSIFWALWLFTLSTIPVGFALVVLLAIMGAAL